MDAVSVINATASRWKRRRAKKRPPFTPFGSGRLRSGQAFTRPRLPKSALIAVALVLVKSGKPGGRRNRSNRFAPTASPHSAKRNRKLGNTVRRTLSDRAAWRYNAGRTLIAPSRVREGGRGRSTPALIRASNPSSILSPQILKRICADDILAGKMVVNAAINALTASRVPNGELLSGLALC